MNSTITILQLMVKRAVFLTIRFILLIMMWIWEELTGVNRIRRQSVVPENYQHSAEIFTIRARNVFCATDLACLSDYILTHDSFTAPEYVLQKDSVSLYLVDENVAVFCDSGETTPLWDMKYGDFFHEAVFESAKRLVVMPISSFTRLSKTMDDPKCEVLFVGNTGRCGSTLLAHIYAKTGLCSVRSEPQAPNCLAKMMRQNRFRSEEMKKDLFLATIKMECKPLSSGWPSAVVMKISANNLIISTPIMEYFPRGKHVFLYRGMVNTTRSYLTILPVLHGMYLAAILNGYSRAVEDWLEARFICSHNPLGVEYSGCTEYSTLMWMSSIKHYLTHRSMPAIRYEDLIKNPREVVTELLKLVGITTEYVDIAVTAFEVDAQTNSPVAANKLKKTRVSQEAIVATCEKMLLAAGLPTLSDCDVLPGTVCVQHH